MTASGLGNQAGDGVVPAAHEAAMDADATLPREGAGSAAVPVVSARSVSKSFGAVRAVDDVNFDIGPGRIMGLIGPNGAGKTTLLKAMLGLTDCSGRLTVLGLDPFRRRKELMREVCFIADVAVLPRWIRVSQLLEFVAAVHPGFSRRRAEELLRRTKIPPRARVRELSKGMVTQLHLSIIIAIDARFLVLDEPTLGLDIIFRKEFYANLLNDYFDGQRTILVTTHQVEEVENLLTDVMFINDGRIVLEAGMDSLPERYVELMTSGENAERARRLAPIHEREVFGKKILMFEDVARDRLAGLGELRTPALADLFVAKVKGAGA